MGVMRDKGKTIRGQMAQCGKEEGPEQRFFTRLSTKIFKNLTIAPRSIWYNERIMILFIALMLTAAFLGMFQKTRDGILCGLALVLLLFVLSTLFPDSVLAAALHALLPFTLHS